MRIIWPDFVQFSLMNQFQAQIGASQSVLGYLATL